MKNPETPMVKVNIYEVVTAGLVIFNILDCIKVRRNVTTRAAIMKVRRKTGAEKWVGE